MITLPIMSKENLKLFRLSKDTKGGFEFTTKPIENERERNTGTVVNKHPIILNNNTFTVYN